MDKKGFLFTVTVFLVLTYILLSVSVWVKGVETSERAYSEFYKESTVELAIEQITPAKMDKVTNTIMYRSLNRLNEHAIDNPVNEGDSEENETENVEAAMYELLVNGSANESYFQGADCLEAESNSSLMAWADNLNTSLLAIGVYISEFDVYDFELGQSDKSTVNYSFKIDLKMRDFSNTSAVSRTYDINNTLDIIGLVDPALARESRNAVGDNKTIYRMFFFHDEYDDVSSLSVSQIPQSIHSGQGWMYAPLALADGTADGVPIYSTIPPTSGFSRSNYILVGTFDEITDLGPSVYEEFGGYIVTSMPVEYADEECSTTGEDDTFNPVSHTGAPECEAYLGSPGTSRPFVVAQNFNVTDAPVCPLLDGSNQTRRCLLMVAAHNPDEVADDPESKDDAGGGLYAIEALRDFVMCGFYVHNPNAPSYLQRLLDDPYERSSELYGIETFVVGNYANDGYYDIKSRLDRELFDDIDGIKIRGMPGCKNFAACSSDDAPITGIFAVSEDVRDEYGLGDIACDDGNAGCD